MKVYHLNLVSLWDFLIEIFIFIALTTALLPFYTVNKSSFSLASKETHLRSNGKTCPLINLQCYGYASIVIFKYCNTSTK